MPSRSESLSPSSAPAVSTAGVPAKAACALALILLLVAGAVLEIRRTTALADVDVWWHLRTGLWILENHGLPHTGIFSQYPQLPWSDTNWGFDVLLAAGYRVLGLAAIPLVKVVFGFALAGLTFLLAGGLRGSFWAALAVSAVAQYSIGQPAPGPVLVSILFFGVELLLLEEARRDQRLLYGLPLLFLGWANFDTVFVAGILVLALFLAALAIECISNPGSANSLPLKPALIATVLCVVASLLNPYTYQSHLNFFADLYSQAAFRFFPQMHALGFRNPRDFLLILFVLSSFFVLGRCGIRRPFLLLVLIAALPVVVRIQRDVWMAVLPATAAFAAACRREAEDGVPAQEGGWRVKLLLGAALAAFAVVVLVALLRLPGRVEMENRVARTFPVRACEFVRQTRPPGPLFNMPDWGGYLAFALPDYPVAVDNRMSLYGDDLYTPVQKLAEGNAKLEDVPVFVGARLLILDSKSDLARALTELPALSVQYRVLYRDDVAVVFRGSGE